MKTIAIINPTAGQSRPYEQSSHIEQVLQDLDCDIVFTEASGDAEHIAKAATVCEKYDQIIVVGGDGTVNEVVNGILSCEDRQVKLPIGVVPMGTSNILATELGIPTNSFDKVMEIVRQGRQRPIDVGVANSRYFTMMASYGFDAEAVKRVQPTVKDLVGAPAYILSGLSILAQHRASIVELRIDDTRVISEAFMVVVANTSSYAVENFKIAPFATIDDGWLDVCIFDRPPNDKIGFITQILSMMARRHLGDPRVRYYRGKRLAIVADPPMLGQIDGDVGGETPTVIEICPRAINFFVP